MNEPLVSVIVPAFNAETYVSETLHSILAQTYRRLEVLVIDDGSTDSTASIVRAIAAHDPRVRLLYQCNQGVAAARNYGIEESRGELIAPIDADDLWAPRKIEKQLRCLAKAGPSAGLCYCWTAGIDNTGFLTYLGGRHRQKGSVFSHHIRQNFIGNASVPLIRKACLDEVGGYRLEFRARGGQGCEDWDLSLRIAERYDFCVVPEYLVGYRKVSGSMSWNHDMMQKSYELMIDDLVRRRSDIAKSDLRISRSHFLLYLVRYRLKRRRIWQALAGLGHAAVLHPGVVAEQITMVGYGRAMRLWYFILRKRRTRRRPFDSIDAGLTHASEDAGELSQDSQVAIPAGM
jgi:glycosyltransferase involved in cell wall biosynthesis